MIKNALNDTEFLKQLDQYRHKTIYAKIISLTVEEFPREEITGKVVSGSINVDGASAVRRTCSLSLIANDVNLNSFYWGLNTKFKLLIGIENHINSNYPKIIWFPQGIYVITNFSSSQNTNSYQISISGKDKMCLLNGDVGGTLTAISTVFDSDFAELEDKSQIASKVAIKTIIYKLVHQLGGEKMSNIIINDLDDYGLELLNYSADIPLYMIFDDNDEIDQVYIDGDILVYYNNKKKSLNELNDTNFKFKSLSPISNNTPTKVALVENGPAIYTISKKNKGETVGYKLTYITYAGELIGVAGNSLTSILDKIKQQLGDFEYFYDVDGRFIFQRVKTYLNVSYSPIPVVDFEDVKLILKEQGVLEEDIEDIISGNFAILEKKIYDAISEEIKINVISKISNKQYVTKDQYVIANIQATPFAYNFEGNQLITSMNNSPNLLNIKNDYIIWGVRKSINSDIEVPIHMRYAIDKKPSRYKSYEGNLYRSEDWDWRELIYQMAKDYINYNKKEDFLTKIANNNPEFLLGVTGYESYYMDMQGFWRQIYNPYPEEKEKDEFYATGEESEYWNKNIYEDPTKLNFWFDFLDTEGELKNFSVQAIGRRQKVVNDDKVKSIYFKSVPLAIFYTDSSDREKKEGYSYFRMGQGMDNFFDKSTQGKSAQEELNTLLYQHTCAQETISLSAVPIYYLNPNTLIYVKDDKNLDINGKYAITRFSIPLSHNGLMNITATKIVDKLL